MKFLMPFILAVFYCSAQPCHGQNISNNEQKISYLQSFAKLYGYVKYFYPGDEVSTTNLQKFAMYGCKKIEEAKTREELKVTLNNLFMPIAPGIRIFEENKPESFDRASLLPKDSAGLKTVSWQYLGINLGSDQSAYRKVRLNRKEAVAESHGFGTIVGAVNAEKYIGKEIKLSAFVKEEGMEGRGQLWVRIDLKDKKMGFFENMDSRPVRSSQWEEYEITGKVDENAEKIVFGGFLSGKGKVWLDDFKLFVKENNKWEPIEIQNPGFEDDKDGKKPKGWSIHSPGYSFRVNSQTAAKGKNSLLITQDMGDFHEALFEKQLHFGDYALKEIGNGLKCIIPLALPASIKNTYPPADKNAFNLLTGTLANEYDDIKYSGDDIYVRLADVIIAWNIFRHFYPYFDVAKTNWDSALTASLASAYNDKNANDFEHTLQKLVAALHDGHGQVSNRWVYQTIFFPAFRCGFIEDKLVVLQSDSETGLQKGDILREVNGKPAIQFLDSAMPYISAATKSRKYYEATLSVFEASENIALNLKIEKPNGKTTNIQLVRNIRAEEYYKKFYSLNTIKWKKPESDVYYINLSRITEPTLDSLIPVIAKAKALICDLRGYPNVDITLLGHLLKKKDTFTHWFLVPQILYPDYEKVTYNTSGWQLQPASPHIKGKVIFITDESAISYAESYMGMVKGCKLATIIGQPTAGTNGNINPFDLPGGYYVSWTGMRVMNFDGTLLHGKGVQPDIFVSRTIKGIRDGRDEFLEAAIKEAKK